MSDETPIKRKLVIVGDSAAGKTALLRRFTDGYLPTEYISQTLHNENTTKKIQIDGSETVEFDLWDTSGQDEFEVLRLPIYAGTHVVLICGSAASYEPRPHSRNKRADHTYMELYWFPEVRRHLPDVPIVLVGIDRGMHYTEEYLIKVKKRIGAVAHMMVSPETGHNIQELFQLAGKVALEEYTTFR